MDANISAFLEPMDKHFEAVFRERVARLSCLGIVVTEVLRRVFFMDAALLLLLFGASAPELADIENLR